jgi:hypothetical protein
MDARVKDIEWWYKDYCHRANYGGMMLHANENNGSWMVVDSKSTKMVATGECPTLDERKAAAIVAAWCHVNGANIEIKPGTVHINCEGAWMCIEPDWSKWEWSLFRDYLDMSLTSGEEKSYPEAQLAAITAYEEWKENQ